MRTAKQAYFSNWSTLLKSVRRTYDSESTGQPGDIAIVHSNLVLFILRHYFARVNLFFKPCSALFCDRKTSRREEKRKTYSDILQRALANVT